MLKLLLDLCHHSGQLPSAYELHNVEYDRWDVIGLGGEAIVYSGEMNGQLVVVREVVIPKREWHSPFGRQIIQVMSNLINILLN